MKTYRYPTTLSQDMEVIIKKKYGRDAHPILIADKSIAGLIEANCPRKSNMTAFNILKQGLSALRV